MKTPRLSWEPVNLVPLELIDERFGQYVRGGKGGVFVLGNGSLLFIKNGENPEEQARMAMEEEKFLTNFEVDELKEGGHLVIFHPAVAVFVSDEEFGQMRGEIIDRISDLHFPSETFGEVNDDKFLVGLYARG